VAPGNEVARTQRSGEAEDNLCSQDGENYDSLAVVLVEMDGENQLESRSEDSRTGRERVVQTKAGVLFDVHRMEEYEAGSAERSVGLGVSPYCGWLVESHDAS